jgi:predicted dehydrogenase
VRRLAGDAVSRRLKVAVIGCGKIGTSGHLPAFAAAARAGLCEIAAVCDVDRQRAAAAARPYGVPAFDSVDALLDQVNPDVVSIATLPSNHRDLTLRALAAGCHVLCEKPIASDAAEAQEMVTAAERAGKLLSLCLQYRWWDEARYVRQRIAAGDLGHVHAVRTWGGAPHAFPRHMSRHNAAIAGRGVLAHWTIHNLDLALWLLGNPEPLTASAFCYQKLGRLSHPPPGSPADGATVAHAAAYQEVDPAVEDFAAALVRLAGGTVVTVEANWLQAPSRRPEGWELLGDRGAAAISPVRVWLERDGQWVDDTPPAGTLAACDYDMSRLMAGFLEAVRAGGPSPVAGPEIVRLQRLMDALYRSADTGQEVPVT